MGRRIRRFRCEDCEQMFWKKFEHISPDEIIELVRDTSCEYCGSDNWTVTAETEFAGGDIGYRHYQLMICRNSYNEFYLKVGGKSASQLRELAERVECPNCSNPDLRLSDGVLRQGNTEDVVTVYPLEEEPDW